MTVIKSAAVFCAAADTLDVIYKNEAAHLGALLAQHKIDVVYGGAAEGLMGIVADAALAEGGRVYGYIPGFLEANETAHPHVTEMHFVDTMHTRKQRMYERSDAFIVLPGGFGTLEEVSEVISWRKINLHLKPTVFVNTHGFWDPYITMLQRIIELNFAPPTALDCFSVAKSSQEAIDYLLSFSKSFQPQTFTR